MSINEGLTYCIKTLMKARRNLLDKVLLPYGITASEVMILKNVYENDGITQDELGEFSLVDRTTISRRIKKLENLGYLRKERDEKDKRAFRIYKTKKANELYELINKTLDDFQATTSKGITDEEKTVILNVFNKAVDNLRKDGYIVS
ncbi:MAG: MarR family transcriptional regulator [Peptostreptococcaceae bacterium]|nr:MarR family transcriptional regulator [Peptostreptococcaceae bacterium]